MRTDNLLSAHSGKKVKVLKIIGEPDVRDPEILARLNQNL
jgi:hypothetical protein